MQYYILDKKSLKQSLANAKSFLKEQDLKLPSGVAEELVAKILFQRNWNDALSNAQMLPKKTMNKKIIHYYLNTALPAQSVQKLIKKIAKQANYDEAAIEEFTAISELEFSFSLNNQVSDKNSFTFLFLLMQCEVTADLQTESFRVEVDKLGQAVALSRKQPQSTHEIPAEVNHFLLDIMGSSYEQYLTGTIDNPGYNYYMEKTKKLVATLWKLETMPYKDRADWIARQLNQAPLTYSTLKNRSNLTNAQTQLLDLLTECVSDLAFSSDVLRSIYGSFIERLTLKTKKHRYLRYRHPACDEYLILEDKEDSDEVALSILVGDEANEQDKVLMTKEIVLISQFEFEQLNEFNG